MCEIFLINAAVFTRVCWCAYYACVPVRARVFCYTLECSQSRLFSVHTHTLESKTEKPLIFFFFRCLLTRKRTPFSLSLPLSPSLRLSFSLSLSAGMKAHVEMLARLHTRTKFSHTKERECGGEGGGVDGGWGVGRG